MQNIKQVSIITINFQDLLSNPDLFLSSQTYSFFEGKIHPFIHYP